MQATMPRVGYKYNAWASLETDSFQPWLSLSRRGLVHAGKGRVVGELGLQEVVASVHWQ